MRHQPEGWSRVQTVVVRRYRNEDEMEGTWHYSFLYTCLTREQLPEKQVSEYGFAQYIWMLYSAKQGRENAYKTWLSDLGGHNPASGRLGASEVMCCLQAIAANVHTAVAYRVMPCPGQGNPTLAFRPGLRSPGRARSDGGGPDAEGLPGRGRHPRARPAIMARSLRRRPTALRPDKAVILSNQTPTLSAY